MSITAPANQFTTHRNATWGVDLLTRTGALLETLPGCKLARVDQDVASALVTSGVVGLENLSQSIDWQRDRMRVWYGNAGIRYVLGTFLISAPTLRVTPQSSEWSVTLLSKLQILEDDGVDATYAVKKGVNVVTRVRELIASTGEPASSITSTASTRNLGESLTWEPGTSKLKIVNELLMSINYRPLWVDPNGTFMVEPYVEPKDAPVRWSFREGETAIHSPEWEATLDRFSVPNKYILTTAGTGEAEGMRAVATNSDPGNPYSYPARGRWVTMEERVEAANSATLGQMARRRLIEASSPASTLTIRHAHIPLRLYDRVNFVSQGRDVTGIVQSMSFEPSSQGLVTTTIQEVLYL